jgi:hypothetical protein
MMVVLRCFLMPQLTLQRTLRLNSSITTSLTRSSGQALVALVAIVAVVVFAVETMVGPLQLILQLAT